MNPALTRDDTREQLVVLVHSLWRWAMCRHKHLAGRLEAQMVAIEKSGDVISDKPDGLEQQVLAVAEFFSKMAVDEDKRLLDCLGDEDNDAAHFHIGRAHAWDDAAGCLRDLIKQYRIPLEEGG